MHCLRGNQKTIQSSADVCKLMASPKYSAPADSKVSPNVFREYCEFAFSHYLPKIAEWKY
jgi:hypothetical protein